MCVLKGKVAISLRFQDNILVDIFKIVPYYIFNILPQKSRKENSQLSMRQQRE